MPLRWISKPAPAQSTLTTEEPVYVLATPGTIPTPQDFGGRVTPRRRLTQVLTAGSLLALAFRPMPRVLASTFPVTNNNPSGPGSLLQAIKNANANPGADVITFDPSVSGTIPLTGTLIVSDSVTIQGPGPGLLSVSGGNARRVFYLNSAGSIPFTTTISGLTIRDGFAKSGNGGGGILDRSANLILDHVAIISNTAFSKADGGGVSVAGSSFITPSLTIRDSVITGNHAFGGGGIAVIFAKGATFIQNSQIVSNSSSAASGGVLFLVSGPATIEDSIIAYNLAGAQGGGALSYLPQGPVTIRGTTISGNNATNGGGLYIRGGSAPTVIVNSTLSGNHATQKGGGLFSYGGKGVSIQNSTIVNNTAGTAGGVAVAPGALAITNTIIAGNTAPDISGSLQLSYDLVQITGTAQITDAGGNLFGLDPLLGPLANNGGPTQTHFPAHSSPAVDAGDPAFAPPPSTDQRGKPRVSGGRIDIGAVETQELFLPLVTR